MKHILQTRAPKPYLQNKVSSSPYPHILSYPSISSKFSIPFEIQIPQPTNITVVYSFIGILPEYILYSVLQTRLFFHGNIYLIYDDYTSPYLPILKKMHVILIDYKSVTDYRFIDLYNKNYSKLPILNELKDRKMLFMRSFERFYLLRNAMKLYNLKDIFFMEIDNMIYNDPEVWYSSLSEKDIWFMFDNYNRISTGVCYIKDIYPLEKMLEIYNSSIQSSMNFIYEMECNWKVKEKIENIGLLPILFEPKHYPKDVYEQYSQFNSIFDAAAIGVYLFGNDPVHTSGKIVKYKKNKWSMVDYSIYSYEWKHDEKGRNIPYINGIRINNLHIHGKNLHECLSIQMDIISGEKFQYLASHYIADKATFSETSWIYNPTLYKHKCIAIEDINGPINNKPIVFIHTHLLNLNKLAYLQNPFVLICHNSDTAFDKVDIFEKTKCKKVFTQNCIITHPDVIPIPIGIANSKWPHGNLSVLYSIIQKKMDKTKDIYFYFDINTCPSKRNECFSIIKNKGIEFDKKRDFQSYLETLSQYKFAICPEGNGIDCHRFWECLYLKVVPICKRNPLVEYFSKFVPAVLLDEWEDLSISNLDYTSYKWDIPILDFKYWKDIIEK
jgi:hypothetical protein